MVRQCGFTGLNAISWYLIVPMLSIMWLIEAPCLISRITVNLWTVLSNQTHFLELSLTLEPISESMKVINRRFVRHYSFVAAKTMFAHNFLPEISHKPTIIDIFDRFVSHMCDVDVPADPMINHDIAEVNKIDWTLQNGVGSWKSIAVFVWVWNSRKYEPYPNAHSMDSNKCSQPLSVPWVWWNLSKYNSFISKLYQKILKMTLAINKTVEIIINVGFSRRF